MRRLQLPSARSGMARLPPAAPFNRAPPRLCPDAPRAGGETSARESERTRPGARAAGRTGVRGGHSLCGAGRGAFPARSGPGRAALVSPQRRGVGGRACARAPREQAWPSGPGWARSQASDGLDPVGSVLGAGLCFSRDLAYSFLDTAALLAARQAPVQGPVREQLGGTETVGLYSLMTTLLS